MAQLSSAHQDFAKQAINDWVEQTHKLSKLYRQTVEERVEQTTETVASMVPFTRKAETTAKAREAA